jgi:tRNA-specific 2-thiouridylase
LKEAFQKAVMDDFVAAYRRGETPNPCVQCNGVLKFRVLLERALALGASHLATGHYAQIAKGPRLHAAVDRDKDQSYFLFPIRTKALDRILFPLGSMTKSEVRAHALRMGLVNADKPDSQEICFLPEGNHAAFVKERSPEVDGKGDIVDEEGRVLGHHDGYWRYTVGQRRGLGVAMGHPVYVSRIEPDSKRVVVAGGESLWHQGLVAGDWNWFERPEPGETLLARIRHNGAPVPCRVGPGEECRVDFVEPAWAVAPGQAVVVYRDGMVLGGGWIRSAIEGEA